MALLAYYFPRYWMVASACAAMVSILCLEAVFLMVHPTSQLEPEDTRQLKPGTSSVHIKHDLSGKGPGIPLDGYENTVSSSLSEKYVKVLPEVHVDLIQPPERNTSEPPERIISEPPERIIKDFSEPPERNLPEKNALSDAADSPEKNAQEQPEGNVLSTFPSGRDVDIVHISSDVPLEHNIHIISNDEQKVPVDGQHMLRRPMALGKLVQMSAAVNKNPHQQSQKQYTKKITLSKKQQASQSLLYQHANTHRMASIRQDLFQLLGGFVPLAETLKDKKRLPMSNKTAGQLSQGKLDTQKNPDASAGVLQRGQMQQLQVLQFCRQHHYSSYLPTTMESIANLFSHLLYDDSKKIVFCYVPKNGCSNMKRLFLILNGILPPESAEQPRPSEDILKTVNSFKDLTPQEAIYRLTYYYKFAVVRHPLERLLSAYRNKLEHPVRYSGLNQFPDYAKVEMLSHFRAAQYQKWLRSWKTETNTSKIPAIFPTFTEFAEYMQVLPFNMYNEHFVPFLDLCHPCSVHYDFYIHFDTMVSDLHVLMDSLSIPTHYYPSAIPAPSHTSDLMKKYFGQLDSNTKVPLYRRFHNELDFYHALNFVSINNTFYV